MNKVRQADFGTPLPKSTDTVRIEIDGLPATVKAGTSILRAARESGVDIPKLCATDSLKPFGSCRMCLVEVEGRKGYPASCTTPVEAGMKIRTQTESLATLRRNVMELYISDHPLDCLTCSANGDCELQDVAGSVGLREVRYGFDGENHLEAEIDTSNPYFQFDASKCIVCSRCVRACDEVQGTFALTIQGRGFESKVSAGIGESFLDSECVSCGACVQACPTATLMEKSIVDHGQPDHSVKTTCAYCGVGCSFVAEMKGDQVVRMTPDNSGGANHGHSCVKGRFAWGYSTHRDRILNPLIRDSIDEPWRQVGWDEAIQFAAKRFKDIQQEFGRKSIGGITSSRCTNEEVFAVQKLVRAAMGNNNVDTCARVCHSPTGYGLKQTLGTSAGTQPFDSVMDADVIVVIGANPTEGHPVFASQMKRRLRQGARLIVVDPRRIGLVKSPHIRADYHLPLLPGTNVPIINAFAHVVVSEGLVDENYVAERCDMESFEAWKAMILRPENSPEEVEKISGVPAEDIRAAARLYGSAEHGAIYYGLGVTEHSQGSTMVMGMANLAMATGNIGFSGGGVNPLRGQNNVQGSCDMGSFPHELAGYRPVQDDEVRGSFENHWGVTLDPEPGFRIPNMFDEACAGRYKGMYIQGEDLAQSDPNTLHVEQALRSMECIVVQDLFLNETAKFAHVFLPGTSFLEKDGTFINAERRINRVRPVMKPRQGKDEWLITQELAQAMGYPMRYNSAAEIMDEIAELTSAAYSGHVTRMRQWARRSCTSTTSCAARACLSKRSLCRPRNAPTGNSHCC
jgi:formate dehydrogenase major subunit